MRHRVLLVGGFAILVTSMLVGAQPMDLDKLKEKPIANGGGKVGDLLRQWWKENTAAGNVGDFYDNRDGDHSLLNLTPYPQLSLFKYTEQDFKLKKNWAAAREVRPVVTFGNSSTSAPAHLGGSNPRSQYTSPFGMSLLYLHYTKNNLYIYPEHRDHDPGHNGRGPGREEGYGDLYPTNTPYLLISQGSSGSDQPFMRMMPSVLAAFRPEVKAKLIETGTLMPTIQMLFRSTNKHLKDPKEYLTGKAHPSVFDGSWVDELALIQKAHALDVKSLPPMVRLQVLDEDKAINGLDYFDLANSEALATTPSVIARVHRSKAYTQRLVVSAEASFDFNKNKLTYTWVVLRGDADKIKIVPKKDDSSTVEITVAYHERRPIAPGSAMESNRVDVGVFVDNGTHYSAPGFVTFLSLDREARTYNERGHLIAISHGMGETEVRVKDWTKLLTELAGDNTATQLLQINQAQRAWLAERGALHNVMSLQLALAQQQLKVGEKDMKDAKDEKQKEKAKKNLDESRQKVAAAQKALDTAVDEKEKALGDVSLRQFFQQRIESLTLDPLFTQKRQAWLKSAATPANEGRIKSYWQKPIRLGIANKAHTLTPMLPGKSLEDAKWTKFERAQLEWLHASLLAELLLPGMLQLEFRRNYVDSRLSTPREWQDLYRYDVKGEFIGWMRYETDEVQMFNHEGLLVVEKDDRWRCLKARPVRYTQEPSKEKGINTNPLRMVAGDTFVRYEFDGDQDMRGRRVKE